MGGSRIPSYLLRSKSVLLKVQILVARDELLYPIIHGYNVIEEMIRKSDKEEAREQFLTL